MRVFKYNAVLEWPIDLEVVVPCINRIELRASEEQDFLFLSTEMMSKCMFFFFCFIKGHSFIFFCLLPWSIQSVQGDCILVFPISVI